MFILYGKEVAMFDLYILESCPYCKKVMDYMRENEIKYHKFDTMNKDNVLRLMTFGGKDQVPFLYNEENGDKLYESDEIIKYLSRYAKV